MFQRQLLIKYFSIVELHSFTQLLVHRCSNPIMSNLGLHWRPHLCIHLFIRVSLCLFSDTPSSIYLSTLFSFSLLSFLYALFLVFCLSFSSGTLHLFPFHGITQNVRWTFIDWYTRPQATLVSLCLVGNPARRRTIWIQNTGKDNGNHSTIFPNKWHGNIHVVCGLSQMFSKLPLHSFLRQSFRENS